MMVIHSCILANSLRARFRKAVLLGSFLKSGKAFFNSMSTHIDESDSDFLPWLEHKAGAKISSTLSIGMSSCGGRGLFASDDIKKGDCILKVPFSVQLTRHNLTSEIGSMLRNNNIDPVSEVALFLLHEKKLGQHSEWAPYISLLPLPHDMNSTIFWTDEELQMLWPTPVYEETLRTRKIIEREFLVIKSVFDRFPSRFQVTTLEEFTYAFHLVKSRAWKSTKRGVSLVPFADFINHYAYSSSKFVDDEEQQHTKIIADCDYDAGNEVVIRYGEYGNYTLLMDYGFTVPDNPFDFHFRNPIAFR